MKSYDSKFKIFILIALLLVPLSLLLAREAGAQTAEPQFLVSWQARSYAPAWYQGKVFPTKGAPVEISFELLDKGKIVDLSKTVVRWYVNDELIKNEDNGLGIKSLRFNMSDYGGQETEIRIALPNYKGSSLNSILRIPSKTPEVVIDNRYPGRRIQTGENLFTAIPFFFNASDLRNFSFDWLANSEKADISAEEPWILKLNVDSRMPSGFVIRLNATVQSLLNQLELASQSLELIMK